MNSDIRLTQIITSLDTNLEDDAFDPYFQCLGQIEQQNPDQSALITILKMLKSLGAYLKSNKTTAHPDTLAVLTQIAGNAETLETQDNLDQSQITNEFQQAHASFKSLKEKITAGPAISDSDLDELKSETLALDWEVSDATVSNFEAVCVRLLSGLKPGSINHSYLRMMQSIVKYIGNKKAEAHTDSVSFLQSILTSFEQVQSADLDFKSKKLKISDDINRFKAFKQDVSKAAPVEAIVSDDSDVSSVPDASDAPIIPDAPDIQDDEELPPALSHVKSGSQSDSGEDMSLTQLPENEESSLLDDDGFEPMPSALEGKQTEEDAPGVDVMDDLFNAKETAADELLDAIHLMDVHGNEDHALKMLDQNDEDQARGVQKFSPRRQDTEPIPEIGNRLDEFFNIEEPADQAQGHLLDQDELQEEAPMEELEPTLASEAPSAPVSDPDPILVPDSDGPDPGLVPFDDEDKTAVEDTQKTDVPDTEQDQADPVAGPSAPMEPTDDPDLDVLFSFLSKHEWETDRWSLQSIQKQCFVLKEQWPETSRKNRLIDIILELSRNLETHANQDPMDEPPALKKESKGFFGKLKGLFSS